MKFLSLDDIKLFLLEVNRIDLLSSVTESFSPEDDMLEMYIKGRRSLVPKLKDFRKSQSTKASWRRNRYKYMSGIKRFHRSTDGKRLHRALSRFIVSRDLSSGMYSRDGEEESGIREAADLLKAITSFRTHLYIDYEYYLSVDEEVDLHLFAEEVLPVLSRIENNIVYSKDIGKEDLDLLVTVVDNKVLTAELATTYSIPIEKVNEVYQKELERFESNENMLYIDVLNSAKLILGGKINV